MIPQIFCDTYLGKKKQECPYGRKKFYSNSKTCSLCIHVGLIWS